jgi:acyl-CoA synthetase (AMP-forming)/AMP-acid ligase II
MPRPVLAQALLAFPAVDFINAYGLTETSAGVTFLPPAELRTALTSSDPRVAARLGSAGRPIPGVELQVRAENGTVVAPGVAGDLYVRGAQVSRAYLETGSALDVDGWFPTRDRGYIDEDGYLFVEGRTDDVIIRGGENIAPAEIEDVLAEHPAAAAVVAVGVPDDEWGERIVAVVVPVDGQSPDPQRLRAFVRDRLRGSRTPDEVVLRAALPLTDTGKVLRRVLVAELTTVH